MRRISGRASAALIHLALSATIALVIAFLVFAVWYPYPYSHISGGLVLFGILVGVDVAVGPLVTMVVFSPDKPRRELVTDMGIIVLLQISAMAYGVWTMHQARPVQLVFEYGRFGVAHAVEVEPALVPREMKSADVFPMTGPGLKALRPFRDSDEQARATLLAVAGVPLAARPDLWQPYEMSIPEVLAQSRALDALWVRYAARRSELEDAVRRSGVPAQQLHYVPMAARGQYWTVLVHAKTGMPLAFVPLDSF